MKNKSFPVLVPVFALLFGSVLFADFIPSVFGAYADQRVLLALLLIAAIVLGLGRLSYKGQLASAVPELWPFLLLVFSFLLAVLQYHSGPFYLVEPVFYALYFLAFGISGYVIRTEGLAREAAQALVLVAAVACFFYAAMTITVYLFAITDDFSRLDQIIPWGFVNIRYWSHVATWVVPLFPLFLLVVPCKRNRLWRLGAAFTGAIWWWLLFLSSSRGSMVGLLFGFVLVWACFGMCFMDRHSFAMDRHVVRACASWTGTHLPAASCASWPGTHLPHPRSLDDATQANGIAPIGRRGARFCSQNSTQAGYYNGKAFSNG